MKVRVSRILLAAPSSGSGKTTVVMAVTGAFKRKGLGVRAFKIGPDYINPMFHRAVTGVEAHNLDFFCAAVTAREKTYVRKSFLDMEKRRIFAFLKGLWDFMTDWDFPVISVLMTRPVGWKHRLFLSLTEEGRLFRQQPY